MNPMNRTKLLRLLGGCLLAGLLVAACAEPDGGDGGAGLGGAPPPGPATPPPPAPGTRPGSPRSGGPVTVTGTVTKGVEPGCLLLAAEDGGQFLLVGGERTELRPGRRLAITGQVDRGLLSTCQQGEPLVVASIEAIP